MVIQFLRQQEKYVQHWSGITNSHLAIFEPWGENTSECWYLEIIKGRTEGRRSITLFRWNIALMWDMRRSEQAEEKREERGYVETSNDVDKLLCERFSTGLAENFSLKGEKFDIMHFGKSMRGKVKSLLWKVSFWYIVNIFPKYTPFIAHIDL